MANGVDEDDILVVKASMLLDDLMDDDEAASDEVADPSGCVWEEIEELGQVTHKEHMNVRDVSGGMVENLARSTLTFSSYCSVGVLLEHGNWGNHVDETSGIARGGDGGGKRATPASHFSLL